MKLVTAAIWSNFFAQIPHKIPSIDNKLDEKMAKYNTITKLKISKSTAMNMKKPTKNPTKSPLVIPPNM